MADTLTELGFPEGGDLALGLATIGIVSGIVSGILLANWGRRKGLIRSARLEPDTGTEVYGVTPEHPDLVAARERLTSDLLVDPISLNLGFVGLSVAAGWLMLEGLKAFEQLTWGGEGGLTVLGYIPLFPMALLGGILVQLLLRRLRLEALVMRIAHGAYRWGGFGYYDYYGPGLDFLDGVGGELNSLCPVGPVGDCLECSGVYVFGPEDVTGFLV